MTERQMLSPFIKNLKAQAPETFVYKDADTYGGARKPFDFYAVHKGEFYAIEAKKGDAKLKPHQETSLTEVYKAGGMAFVLRFDNDRHVKIHPYYEYEFSQVYVEYLYNKGYTFAGSFFSTLTSAFHTPNIINIF